MVIVNVIAYFFMILAGIIIFFVVFSGPVMNRLLYGNKGSV